MYSLSDTMATETNGHAANTQNGNEPPANGVLRPPAPFLVVPKNENLHLDKTNTDIVKLIGQHLKAVGLE